MYTADVGSRVHVLQQEAASKASAGQTASAAALLLVPVLFTCHDALELSGRVSRQAVVLQAVNHCL